MERPSRMEERGRRERKLRARRYWMGETGDHRDRGRTSWEGI